MRNNAKRLLSLLLAALLVFSLSLTGFAAEEKSLLSLSQSEDVVKGGKVTIQVDTAVDGVVADGKLTAVIPVPPFVSLRHRWGQPGPRMRT